MIKHCFLKTGIAVGINGSEDDETNVEGLDESYINNDESSDDHFQT